MRDGPRLTPQTIEVVRYLLEEPRTPRYGRELGRAVGLPSGTLHPILIRLEQAGWLESFWEDPEAHEDQGRPRRRYYRFTTNGAERARHALASLGQTRTTPSTVRLRPQPGF